MVVDAIVFTAKGTPRLQTVELARELLPNELRVRTLCSGVSIGTERLLWEDRLSYAKFPQVLGYQSVGEVEEVGVEATGFAVGDRVIIRQSRFEGEAAFPVSGCHAAAAVAQQEQCLRVPDTLDPVAGSLYVLVAVGFHGVAMAGVGYTDTVAVQGCGMVGLAVVIAARLRGARIAAIDPRPERRQAALALGADIALDPGADETTEALARFAPPGADVVFESTGFGRLLDAAFELARPHGRFVFQGNYGGDAPISFQFIPPHGKQLTCYFPCNDGLLPCRRAVTQLLARGQIDLAPAITHVVRPAEAVAVYEEIIAGGGAATAANGIVIDWR